MVLGVGPVSDIVERLRQGIECGEEGDAEAAMEKAADEIERLRFALGPSVSWADEMKRRDDQIERLRMRHDNTIAVRFPTTVREAIDRAAARDFRSLSDIVRQATVEHLRANGLLNEPAAEIERLRVYATKLHWALVDIRDNAFVYSADRIAEKAAAPLEPLE